MAAIQTTADLLELGPEQSTGAGLDGAEGGGVVGDDVEGEVREDAEGGVEDAGANEIPGLECCSGTGAEEKHDSAVLALGDGGGRATPEEGPSPPDGAASTAADGSFRD